MVKNFFSPFLLRGKMVFWHPRLITFTQNRRKEFIFVVEIEEWQSPWWFSPKPAGSHLRRTFLFSGLMTWWPYHVHLPPGRIRNVTRSSRDQKETIFEICGRCLSLYLSYYCLLLYCQAKSTVRLSQVTLYETASFPLACVPPWTRTEKGREPNEEKTFFVPSPIKDSSLQVLLKNEGMCFDSPGD